MPEFSNKLLRKLSPADQAEFTAYLERVDLTLGSTLLEPDAPIEHVYFPESGVCSILAVTSGNRPNEIGMFGSEGMSNFVARLGGRSFFKTVVLIEGMAWRIRAEDFSRALLSLVSLNEVVIRYKDSCAVQFGYSAYASGVFSVEERLARWMLMVADRVAGEKFRVTHDTVANLLSVRRSGITTATHVLEGMGAIKAERAAITIRNRERLEDIAGESYGNAERAYRELMGD